MIAALFVLPDGPYANREGVDAWPESRDARLYPGPWATVCHPPCSRWGSYWFGGPNPRQRRRELGDDAGCFASALASVRQWGGVIEHPANSRAWKFFGIARPEGVGVWTAAAGGWTAAVDQGHYGHVCRKPTWLYVFGVSRDRLPELPADRSAAGLRRHDALTGSERRRVQRLGTLSAPGIPRKWRALTPPAFADLLISIAERAQPSEAAA